MSPLSGKRSAGAAAAGVPVEAGRRRSPLVAVDADRSWEKLPRRASSPSPRAGSAVQQRAISKRLSASKLGSQRGEGWRATEGENRSGWDSSPLPLHARRSPASTAATPTLPSLPSRRSPGRPQARPAAGFNSSSPARMDAVQPTGGRGGASPSRAHSRARSPVVTAWDTTLEVAAPRSPARAKKQSPVRAKAKAKQSTFERLSASAQGSHHASRGSRRSPSPRKPKARTDPL